MSDFDTSQLSSYFKPNDIIEAPLQKTADFERLFLSEMDGYLRSLQAPQVGLPHSGPGAAPVGTGKSDTKSDTLSAAMKDALQQLRQNEANNLRVSMASHSYRIMTQTLVKIVDSFTDMLKRIQQS